MKYLRAVVFILFYLLIFLAIPLLGWGAEDLGGFFALAPRVGYTAVAVAYSLATGWQAIDRPEGIIGRRGEETKLVRRQSIVRIAIGSLLYGLLFLVPKGDRYQIGMMVDGQGARWPGVILFGLGCGLVFWSGVALGRLYSADVTIQKDHRLITSGPYGTIRHPRYLGGMLIVIGASHVFRSMIGLGLSALLLGLYLYRIRDEEALMHREFGQEWESYCRRSWRLVPYVY